MKVICKKHGPYEAEVMSVLGYEVQSSCPECAKEEEAQEQKAQRVQRERSWMNRGIEPEYFDTDLSKYRPETASEQEALQAILDLKAGKLKKVCLLGSNGCGKTMLGSALAIELGGVVTTTFALSGKIRTGFNTGRTEYDTLNDLLYYPLIVIDEIGRSKMSEAELNWLSYLIDKAHVRGTRLVLISNRLTAKTLGQAKIKDSFEMCLPNDVLSRLRQGSRIVEIKGRDRRATLAV